MIEFKELTCLTPAAVFAHERAPALIAPPDGTLDLGGDVTSGGSLVAVARPGLLSRRELALLELANQGVERALEHSWNASRRNLVAQQLLRIAQLVVQLLAHGELQRKSPGSQRRHPGSLGRGLGGCCLGRSGSRCLNDPRG